MTCHAPSHLRFAAIGDDVIMLDLSADRYARLGRHLSYAVRSALENQTGAIAHPLLTDAGFHAPPDVGRPIAPPQVATARREALAEAPFAGEHRLACLAAIASARLGLRCRGLARTIDRAVARAEAANRADLSRAVALARSFEAARAWFPWPRRCLADSLALHALLSRRSLACTLVIGVRDRPFVAHCWVQADDIILTDSLDDVVGLTPILAI